MKLTRDVGLYKCMCALDACDSTPGSLSCSLFEYLGRCMWERMRGVAGGYEKCKKSTKSERAMHAKAACERIVFLYVLKNAINLRRKLSHVNGGYKRVLLLCECVCVCVASVRLPRQAEHNTHPHLWGMPRTASASASASTCVGATILII